MQTEEAGLEVLSGCLGLLALLTVGSGSLIAWVLGKTRARPTYDLLTCLMIDFIRGPDRSEAAVGQIHALLLRAFLHAEPYEELTTAVASFVPGGTAPFLDETRLAEAFRTFLKKRRVVVPEYLPEQAGVWPPAPRQ